MLETVYLNKSSCGGRKKRKIIYNLLSTILDFEQGTWKKEFSCMTISTKLRKCLTSKVK